MDTINICVVGEVSVGKTTLVSTILNKQVGTIKRSRSTLKYYRFTENKTSNDFLGSELISEYVEPLDIFKNDNKLYNVAIYDTIGCNDIEIDDQNEIFLKLQKYIDIFIIVLDATKGCN